MCRQTRAFVEVDNGQRKGLFAAQGVNKLAFVASFAISLKCSLTLGIFVIKPLLKSQGASLTVIQFRGEKKVLAAGSTRYLAGGQLTFTAFCFEIPYS